MSEHVEKTLSGSAAKMVRGEEGGPPRITAPVHAAGEQGCRRKMCCKRGIQGIDIENS